MSCLKYFKLLFVSISCVLSLSACVGNDAPEVVAQNFVQAATKGDIDKILKLGNTSEASAAELEEIQSDLKEIVIDFKKEIDAQGGAKSIKAVGTEISEDGNIAKVMIQLETNSGKGGGTKPVKLKKIDGKWRLVL